MGKDQCPKELSEKAKLPDISKLGNLSGKFKGIDTTNIKTKAQENLQNLLNKLKNFNWRDIKNMADKAAGAPSRPMKFPYTFSAKIAQFPLKHYFQNQWIWRYYGIALLACVPVFMSIHNLANSPGNVAKWAEIRRKEAAEHH